MSVPMHEEQGPLYPQLGQSVIKFRRLAREGLAALSYEQKRDYADAVFRAVRALQRRDIMREATSLPAPYRKGFDILAAVRNQQRAKLLACPDQVRRARTDQQLRGLYAEAMKAKQATTTTTTRRRRAA